MRMQAGDYVTDGIGLFRVVRHFDCSGERYAELEDCRTLELLVSRRVDLERPELRIVRRRLLESHVPEPALA